MQTAYFFCMFLYGLLSWSVAAQAVAAEIVGDGIGQSTVLTSAWVIGWANVIITQVIMGNVATTSLIISRHLVSSFM